MKKINKVAISSLAALMLTTSLANSQTTITGDMRIGMKATSSDNKGGSDTKFVKETQINFTNAGNLNFGGGKYVAGFSLEYDGNDTAFANAQHIENTYIDMLFGNTMVTFGNDHFKPTNVLLSEIINGPHGVFNIVNEVGRVSTSTTAKGDQSIIRSVYDGEKGDGVGFGIGLRQTMPNVGAFSVNYIPNRGNDSLMNDTGSLNTAAAGSTFTSDPNSQISLGFRGNFGVKALDLHVGYNQRESDTPGQSAAAAKVTNTTVGIGYKFGNLAVGLDATDNQYNATGSDYKVRTLGLAYAVDKDLTVQYNHGRGNDSTAGSVKEKVHGVTIAQSLGPVGLTISAAKIDNSNGIAANDGKAVMANLGVRF